MISLFFQVCSLISSVVSLVIKIESGGITESVYWSLWCALIFALLASLSNALVR